MSNRPDHRHGITWRVGLITAIGAIVGLAALFFGSRAALMAWGAVVVVLGGLTLFRMIRNT